MLAPYPLLSMLLFRFFNVGNFALFFLSAALFGTGLFAERLAAPARHALYALWGAVFAAILLVTALMLHAAYCNPAIPATRPTLLVLGADVNGNAPSLILERRLQAALHYLNANPESKVVVSGGQGADEAFCESTVMSRWLTMHGVAHARIYEENRSATTGQNICFSAALVRREGLSTHVLLCTDGFHQLRAAILARQNGLLPTALPSRTPLGLVPMYYAREWFGLIKAVFLKA